MSDEHTSPASNAAIPVHPRQVMTPGWYWKLLSAAEAGSLWTAFTRDNPAVKTRKTKATGEGTAAQKGSWVLFEVTGDGSVLWTLPGLPSKAPLGASTSYEDVIQLPPPEESTTDLLTGIFSGLHSTLGSAGTVVVWGGVGILLWRLVQRSAPQRRSRA